jgi:hypothetical protein
MSDLISSDGSFGSEATAVLAVLAGTMIPAREKYGVPGADDADIVARLLQVCSPFRDPLLAVLSGLNGAARETHDMNFTDLETTARLAFIETFRAQAPEVMGLLVSLITQCYYTDDRIMASLGMAPRPPFPEGYEVPQGDWSLLDPVRARGSIYRRLD